MIVFTGSKSQVRFSTHKHRIENSKPRRFTLLGHIPYRGGNLSRLHAKNGKILNHHRTSGRAMDPVYAFQQGCLADPVGSEDGEDFSGANRKTDVPKNIPTVVPETELINL